MRAFDSNYEQPNQDRRLSCSECENITFDTIESLIEHNREEHKLNGL